MGLGAEVLPRGAPASPPGNGATIRRFVRPALMLLPFAAGAVFIVLNRHAIPAALDAARGASLPWLLVALALSAGYLAAFSLLHGASLRAVGVRLPWRVIAVRATAAHYVSTIVVNSAGMAGLPVLAGAVERAGKPRGRAITAYVLAVQLGQLAFAGVLAVAMLAAVAGGQATRTEWIASAIFAFYTLAALAMLIAAFRSRGAVRFVHAFPSRARAWVLRRFGRDAHAADTTAEADELYDALALLRRPRVLAGPVLAALAIEATGVGMLWACLLAFGVHTGPVTPLIGYAMAVLFSVVGFMPGGLGFAEAGLGVALAGAGVPGPEAALTVVAYRALELWVPFALGAWAMHRVARGAA